MKTIWLRHLLCIVVVLLSGCSAINVKLGRRVDLTKTPVTSIEVSLPKGPGIAPGQKLPLVVTAMQTNRFETMGVNRSYWDFILGYGLVLTVKFLVETVVFWQLASLLKAYGLQVRPLLIALWVGYVADAFMAWRYFFAGPAVFEIVIAGCLFWAWWLAGRAPVRTV